MKSFNLIKLANKMEQNKKNEEKTKQDIARGLALVSGATSGVAAQDAFTNTAFMFKRGLIPEKTFSFPVSIGLLGTSVATSALAQAVGPDKDELDVYRNIGLAGGALGITGKRIKHLADIDEKTLNEKGKEFRKELIKYNGISGGALSTAGGAAAYIHHRKKAKD